VQHARKTERDRVEAPLARLAHAPVCHPQEPACHSPCDLPDGSTVSESRRAGLCQCGRRRAASHISTRSLRPYRPIMNVEQATSDGHRCVKPEGARHRSREDAALEVCLRSRTRTQTSCALRVCRFRKVHHAPFVILGGGIRISSDDAQFSFDSSSCSALALPAAVFVAM
jgi:hypothetical protein